MRFPQATAQFSSSFAYRSLRSIILSSESIVNRGRHRKQIRSAFKSSSIAAARYEGLRAAVPFESLILPDDRLPRPEE